MADSIVHAFRRIALVVALVAAALVAVPAAAPAVTVVSLTFDDGAESQYVHARPQLNALGMRGTFFVNSGYIGANPYFMTWGEVDTLNGEGHEIGGHTVTDAPLTAPGVDIRHQICDDAATLRSRGYRVVSFAYPHGAGGTNATVRQTLRACGYASARKYGDLRGPDCPSLGCLTAEGIPPVDPYRINSLGSQHGRLTLAQLQRSVTQAEQSGGGWVPLALHDICDCPRVEDSVTPSDFATFLAWLKAREPAGTVVRTIRAVIVPSAEPAQPGRLGASIVADRVTGFAALRVRRRQDVDKLSVRAAMSEPGILAATATVGVPRTSRGYRFKRVARKAVPGKLTTLRLKLSKKALRAVKSALRRRKKLKARITITARDRAGNTRRAKRTVRLRP